MRRGLEGPQHATAEDIKEAYREMLTPLQGRMGDVKDGVTSMPLMKGSRYTGNSYEGKPIRVLFVGRAPNGWEIDFSNAAMPEIVDRVFASAINMNDIAKGKVTDEAGKVIYNYNRSPFFQLCRKTLGLFGIEENWSQRMAWTNLYKVAPYKTGNPNNNLIRQTLADCGRILKLEISHLRPTHIIFVTGNWWYEPTGEGLDERTFINATGVDLYEDTNQLIIGGGISELFHFHPKIVITNRPEGAKASRAEHAKAIFDAFAAMEDEDV